MRVRHPDGQVFTFDAGALCLEFVFTGGEGARARFETFHSPADIARWTAGSRLDPAGHGVDPAAIEISPAEFDVLWQLREALWTLALTTVTARPPTADAIETGRRADTVADAIGTGRPADADAIGTGRPADVDAGRPTAPRPLDVDAVAVVNELAAGAGPVLRLAGGRAVWRQPVTGAQLAAEIARDAVLTFAEPTVGRIRKCGADNCYLIYLDTSRPGRRRWCSMQRCGNRHKIHEFRHRHATPEESP